MPEAWPCRRRKKRSCAVSGSKKNAVPEYKDFPAPGGSRHKAPPHAHRGKAVRQPLAQAEKAGCSAPSAKARRRGRVQGDAVFGKTAQRGISGTHRNFPPFSSTRAFFRNLSSAFANRPLLRTAAKVCDCGASFVRKACTASLFRPGLPCGKKAQKIPVSLHAGRHEEKRG